MSEVIVKNPRLIEQIMVLKLKIQLLLWWLDDIKHVSDRDISRSRKVKVRPNPGASTHDLMDYVKPTMRKKPKGLVIHTDTNDIWQEINTVKMFKELVKVIKEIDSEKETELYFLV